MAKNIHPERFSNDEEVVMFSHTRVILGAKVTFAVIVESALWTRSSTDISTVNQCSDNANLVALVCC